MSSAIEMVFFDAFGTLIYLPSSVGEHYREIGLRHNLNLSADILNRAFRSRWKAAPPRRNTPGGPRPDDDKGWWSELVRGILADVAPEEMPRNFSFTAYFEELYAHFAEPGVWSAFPDAPEVLVALKSRGIRLGVISNFDRRLYRILDGLSLRLYFSRIVISSEVGADKPDPRIFQAALRSANVAADVSVHVGDEPERDGGAKAVGMRVYQLDRPDRTLRGLPRWLDSLPSVENRLASRPDLT